MKNPWIIFIGNIYDSANNVVRVGTYKGHTEGAKDNTFDIKFRPIQAGNRFNIRPPVITIPGIPVSAFQWYKDGGSGDNGIYFVLEDSNGKRPTLQWLGVSHQQSVEFFRQKASNERIMASSARLAERRASQIVETQLKDVHKREKTLEPKREMYPRFKPKPVYTGDEYE